MFSALATLLSKLADMITTRSNLKKDRLAALKMYELYISFRNIIKTAMEIKKELDHILKMGDSHKAHLVNCVKKQAENINCFVNSFHDLLIHIEIFDKQLYEDIERIIGQKYIVLKCYYELLENVNENSICLNDYLSMAENLKIKSPFFRIDKEQYNWLPKKVNTYSLDSEKDLKKLRRHATQSISQMKNALNKISDLIKSSCEVKDFFPDEITYDWGR